LVSLCCTRSVLEEVDFSSSICSSNDDDESEEEEEKEEEEDVGRRAQSMAFGVDDDFAMDDEDVVDAPEMAAIGMRLNVIETKKMVEKPPITKPGMQPAMVYEKCDEEEEEDEEEEADFGCADFWESAEEASAISATEALRERPVVNKPHQYRTKTVALREVRRDQVRRDQKPTELLIRAEAELAQGNEAVTAEVNKSASISSLTSPPKNKVVMLAKKKEERKLNERERRVVVRDFESEIRTLRSFAWHVMHGALSCMMCDIPTRFDQPQITPRIPR
jgi:hypothetical protein